MDKIVIGGHEFTREDILSGEVFVSNSIPCDELAADALNASLDGSEEQYTIFAPSDADGLLTVDDELFTVLPRFRVLVHDLSTFGYGEPVLYYRGGTLVGKFYLVRPQRVGKHTFDISCTSAIGLLDRLQHYGGIYNGTPAGAVIADVIGGAIEYTVAPAVASIPVYGWLPVGTRRDNLRQILFATGASIKKSAIGEVNITFLDSDGQTNISDDRMSLSGSVDYKTPATAVAVTEHSYGQFATDETVTLYDGPVTSASITTPAGAEATGMLVKFASPVHTLSIVGSTIVESGVNYAVIVGGNVTLTGKKYTHTTNVIMRQAKNLPIGAQENLVKVEEATLVSAANSGNVAERVLAFYSASRVVRARIVYGDERPGDAVAFNDPFGDDAAGLIQSQSISISNTLMADTEIAVGYAPTGGGNNFENFAVLTGAGKWTRPGGAGKIRVVLIGGGTGGQQGSDGEAGKRVSGRSIDGAAVGPPEGDGGQGGIGGTGGTGGNVVEIDIDADDEQEFDYSCGLGGAPGATGQDTEFDGVSSTSGSPRPNGYVNLFTGEVYAGRGPDGVQGGDGGRTTQNSLNTFPGEDVGNNTGGAPGATISASNYTVQGGSGGGAAFGANGNPGGNASVTHGRYIVDGREFASRAVNGAGGRGADAVAATLSPQAKHGTGGQGGHGGGGGGNCGGGVARDNAYGSIISTAGAGGLGGQGSAGAPGCVIIYY